MWRIEGWLYSTFLTCYFTLHARTLYLIMYYVFIYAYPCFGKMWTSFICRCLYAHWEAVVGMRCFLSVRKPRLLSCSVRQLVGCAACASMGLNQMKFLPMWDEANSCCVLFCFRWTMYPIFSRLVCIQHDSSRLDICKQLVV